MSPLFPDVLSYAEENLRAGATRLDCVRASEQCLKEQACSTKYRTMRQCVAGGKESNFSMVAGLEAKDECRSAMDALKQSPLYNCRCKRGMKKEKNCLRIYWGIYQTLQGWFSAFAGTFSCQEPPQGTPLTPLADSDLEWCNIASSDQSIGFGVLFLCKGLSENETIAPYYCFPPGDAIKPPQSPPVVFVWVGLLHLDNTLQP